MIFVKLILCHKAVTGIEGYLQVAAVKTQQVRQTVAIDIRQHGLRGGKVFGVVLSGIDAEETENGDADAKAVAEVAALA